VKIHIRNETLICTAPAAISGTVDVRVWNFVGVSPITPGDRFTYGQANGLFVTQFAITRTITPAEATLWLPAGYYISYELIVTNPMPAAATSVVLTDVLPAETTIVSCGACSGNNLTLTFASIPYGVPVGASVLVRVNDNVQTGTIISNTATVTSSSSDPDLSDNTATTTVVFPFQ
jgi:uncharacterized repeat protein (TIGR01451 family)